MVSAALLLFSLPALAALPQASGAWLRAEPPRRDLPAIEVKVGYPGGYIPDGNVPIVLRANPVRPFEGAISFRVLRRHSWPTPVITRVNLKPGQPWSFRTWANIPVAGSELSIEWRDRDLRVLSTASVAQIPQPRRRVLRVVDDTTAAPAVTLGEPTYAVTPGDLSREAQWYGGFRALTIRTAVWLDLPAETREAIFGSGIATVFIGTPREGQTIGPRDELLLPVSFRPNPTSYIVPWPYTSGGDSVPATMSWTADPGQLALGSPGAPYLVRDGWGVAWVADEKALELPLPAMHAVATGKQNPINTDGGRPTAGQFLRAYVPMIATILAALLSLALWLVSRRAPRIAIAAVALGSSLLIIAAEKRIRPLPDHHEIEVVTQLSRGLVERHHRRYTAGLSPMDEDTRPRDVTSWIHGGDHIERQGEIRGPNTLPGAGGMLGHSVVEAALRWSSRRDAGSVAEVAIIRRDPSSITLQFDAPHPINEIRVSWLEDQRHVSGAITLNARKSGVVTVHAGKFIWQEGSWFIDEVGIAGSHVQGAGTTVWLVQRTRARTKAIRWWQPRSGDENELLRIGGWLGPNVAEPGTMSGTFVLPTDNLEGRSAKVVVPGTIPIESVLLTWPGGSATARVSGGDTARQEFAIPAEALQQIAGSGRVFQVTVPGTASTASIVLGRKS
jgi:hypothetical protein